MPRDMPITREMVYTWITGWKLSKKDLTLEDWIRNKVSLLGLEDDMVNTSGHDNMADETPVAEMIVMDLESYSNAPSS